MLDWGFAQVDQQWYTTPADLANAERMYAEVKPLQPKYWRIGAAWPLIAKTKDPGTFIAGTPPTSTGRDWSTLDTSLNEALLLGTEIVLILGVRKAAWGGFQFGPFSFGATTGTPADFGVWCAEVATRYIVGGPGVRTDGKYAPNSGKGVSIFEIWNEQNDQNHWGGQISAQDYTNHLIAAHDAIKAVSGLSGTNSRILFGGTYHVQRIEPWWGYGIASLPEVEFLTQCYTYGAKDHFDAMNVHIYPHLDASTFGGSDVGPVPTMNLDNMKQLEEIRALMVSKGDGAKPISVTEAGFPVSIMTEAQQKSYWETLWDLLEALPYVDMVLFYCARDGGGTVDSINGSLGAMRADFTKRPVWEWLQTLSPPPSVNPAFSGSGTLAASVVRVVAAAFSGAGVLGATTPPRATAAFSGAGELSAMADLNSNERNANLDGTGTLSATATPSLSVTAPFTGLGALTATTKPSLSVTAPFTGLGALSSAAAVVGAGKDANFTGEGTLSVVAFTPVLWNSTGAGNRTATTGSSISTSWSHNATVAGDDVWVFAELGLSYSAGATFSSGCNYGSTAMTSLGTKIISGAVVQVFGLQNPPTGSQTVTATYSGGTWTSVQGTSVAFTNVGDVGTPVGVAAGAPSTTRSVTVPAGPGSRVLAISAGAVPANTALPITGTLRYNGGGDVTGNGDYVTIHDAPGEEDGFVTMTVTQLASSLWVALGVELTPAVASSTAAAAFTSDGSLSASGFESYLRNADFTGSGTLSAATVEVHTTEAAFAGAGVLSGDVAGNPAAAFAGSGTLSATTAVAVAAALSGAGTLSATASTAAQRLADFTGGGTLSATVQVPPAYDATGAGSSALLGFDPSINVTWSHTATGSNRAVIVAVSSINNGLAATGQTRAVTYGGVTMTSLGMQPDTSGGTAFMELFGLLNPATGAQTVSVTVSGGGNTGRGLIASSVSYTGVGSFGTAYTNFATGTAMSVAATSTVSELVHAAFETQGAQSAYNKTQRYSGQVGGHNLRILGGDAPGATSVGFTATTGSSNWSAVAARLLPV